MCHFQNFALKLLLMLVLSLSFSGTVPKVQEIKGKINYLTTKSEIVKNENRRFSFRESKRQKPLILTFSL